MKQLTNTLACTIMAVVLILSSCSNGSSNKKETDLKAAETPKSIIREVAFDSATADIKRYGDFWRSQQGSPGYINQVTRAFKIPASDLIGVLQPSGSINTILSECTYKYARAYLGLDVNNTMHLYFTPVEDDGSEAGKDVILTNGSEKIVFDLTSPCPNTCDVSSPLYQAFDQQ